tara:strand:+ start:482 stop:706 length:225 start_codon:yes stop_codon:yes gene_type:complete
MNKSAAKFSTSVTRCRSTVHELSGNPMLNVSSEAMRLGERGTYAMNAKIADMIGTNDLLSPKKTQLIQFMNNLG